jgi:hypothetical protein
VVLVGDAVLVHLLPVAGDATPVFGAVLLSGLVNLVTVAVAAPLLGMFVRRRRGDLPRAIARDYAGAGLLVAVAAALAMLGVAHHPAVLASRRVFAAQSAAVRRYVALQAPLAYRRRVGRADTLRLDTNLFRTCVPGDDPSRWLCLIVDTATQPPGITVDSNQVSNSNYG